MSAHNIISQLTEAQNSQGKILVFTAGTPTASVAGFSRGALAVDTDNGKLFINTGSSSTATWTVVGAQTT